MTVEDLVRDALRAQAGSPDADAETLDRITVVGARRRRRHAAAVIVGGLAALVLVAVLSTQLFVDGGGGLVDVQPDPPAERAPEPPTPEPAAPEPASENPAVETPPPAEEERPPAAPPRPDVAVVALADATTNRVVAIRTNDGQQRVLYERPRATEGDMVGDVALAPDGTVWIGAERSTCENTGTLLKVPVGGGPVETVGPGFAPAVSPDGRWLAYGAQGGFCSNDVVVRDLASGAERRWTYKRDDPSQSFETALVTSLAWSPDSRHLAAEFGWEGTWVRVIDTGAPPGTLVGSTGPEYAARTMYGSPTWIAADRLAMWAVCCATDELGYDNSRNRVVHADPATGAELGGFDPAFDIATMEYVPGGGHLLYVTTGGELFAGWADAAPQRLATNVVVATW